MHLHHNVLAVSMHELHVSLQAYDKVAFEEIPLLGYTTQSATIFVVHCIYPGSFP